MADEVPFTTLEKAGAYEALLAQARQIRGISLWKDAWRRLRKNRAAMASLAYLIGLAMLAFLTPLLPLQSPQHQTFDESAGGQLHQYQAPRLLAARLAFDPA